MAHSPNTQQEGEVLEGLICPICFQDFKTISQLQDHVDLAHSADEQDVFQTLKGFFGKAKKKILKQENECEDLNNKPVEDSSQIFENAFQISEYLSVNQEIGSVMAHTAVFKKLRDDRIDRYVIETNKLLILLDRLITEAPEDPEKRKAHEKNIVPWIPDGDVRLCPGCAKSFGLPRRRHHCRLCGGVMCQTCSKFIDFAFAKKLIQPTFQDSHLTSHSAPPTPMQRRGSNTSLLSVVNFAGDPHIRICQDCHALLIRRSQQLERHGHKSIIVQKYEKMREYMKEIEKLAPLYQKIVQSLCAGETNYYLRDAREVKIKMSKLAEGVDQLSKIIAKLPITEESGGKAAQLQNKIRLTATEYLRDTILGLPPLPTDEEVTHYKRKREEQIKRRIQLEQEAELQNCAKNMTADQFIPQSESVPKSNQKASRVSQKQEIKSPVLLESGWSASPSKVVHEEDNPMLQQMNIIREYIKQARMDHKYDEMHMLEANLKELQLEYWKEQKASPT